MGRHFEGKAKSNFYDFVYGTDLIKTTEAGVASDEGWYFQLPEVPACGVGIAIKDFPFPVQH